jgi:putative ubiquitin-RnfH superfamily antitoxin RatB of RatAB toxin-antitoxin module
MPPDSALAGIIRVEVAYARPDCQWLLALDLQKGATARDALLASGLLAECPELQIGEPVLGVWSRKVSPDVTLEAGDRLEIYRPLVADPKAARRQRALRQRSKTREAAT